MNSYKLVINYYYISPKLLVNYTDIPLTEAMEEVGWLGKNFVPDREHTNHVDVSAGHLRLVRDMRWDNYFQQKEGEGEEDSDEEEVRVQEERILKDKVRKTNLPRGWAPPKALQDFESSNSFNLVSPNNLRKISPNISPMTRAAITDLQELSKERVVIIKPTDKTGGLAVLPFPAYDKAMRETLSETFVNDEGEEKPKYPSTSPAKLKEEFRAINKILKEGFEKGFFSEKDWEAARPEEPKAGRLYGLPKDHKPVCKQTGIPPLRCVVSCCGGNLEGLGKLVDYFLRPVDEAAQSFIQDTPHLLRMIERLNSQGPQPPGTRLYTMDVIAMYPSIPSSRAPAWVRRRCLQAGMDPGLVDWLVRAIELMLRSSTFEYDSELYTQTTGCSIGAPFACSYSGVAMAEVEEEGMMKWQNRGGVLRERKGLQWKQGDVAEVDSWGGRFRDDCLGLFRGRKLEFNGFVASLNSVDKDIKFTTEIDWEENKVIFLDLVISIDGEGYLQTDLHTKPNAKNTLLLPSSCHKPSVTRSSVFSLALRITRICSTPEAAQKRYEELAERLREREYSEAVITAGIDRAKAVARVEALKKVDKKEEEEGRQHRLVVEWDRRSSPALAGILETNYKEMVGRDQRLGKVFPKVPRPAFKRGKNVKEMLCRAKLPPVRRVNTRAGGEEARHGLTRCNRGLARRGCVACPFITSQPNEVVKSVKIHNTGQRIPVEGRMNCKTKGGFLYLLWSAKVPAVQYLGSSEQEPRRRLGGHKGDIENQRLNKAVAKHFHDTKSTVKDLVFVPFKRLRSNDRLILKHFENKAINEFNLIAAGVNRILA
jgi:hypothetical protein